MSFGLNLVTVLGGIVAALLAFFFLATIALVAWWAITRRE